MLRAKRLGSATLSFEGPRNILMQGETLVVRLSNRWISRDEELLGNVETTKKWADFVTAKVGSLKLASAAKLTIIVKPLKKTGVGVMNLRALVSKPAGQ